MKTSLISVILVCMYMPDPAVKADTPLYVADIEIQKLTTGTSFQGIFLNNSTEQVRFVYRLTIHKRGKSGRSSSSQGGFFTADPGEKKSLSQIQMNVQDDDVYSITLHIYHGQDLVAEKFIRSSFDI